MASVFLNFVRVRIINTYLLYRFGVGFHHAGLTTDERDILEANFKSGTVPYGTFRTLP